MKHFTVGILGVLVCSILFILGYVAGDDAEAVDIANLYQVETVNYDVLVRQSDGQTWVLNCNARLKKCTWEHIERLEPEAAP